MRETQEAFERLLRATEMGETPPPPTGAAEQEAAELVALAERLHRMQYLQVSPGARQRILVKALNTPFEPRRGRILQFPTRAPEWTRTAARIAASVAAIAVLGGTVSVSASAASLPDSPLYPVKLLVEDVRVAVALPEQKPRLYAEQAAQRLQETEAMIESGNIPAAERSADVANQRLAAARTSVDGTAQPEVRTAIDKATDQAAVVNKRLEQQGGTAPKPAVVASLVSPTPRPAAPTPETSATPEEPAATSTSIPSEASATSSDPTAGTAAVGAPARGFTPIAGSDASPASNLATLPSPTAIPAEARVVAPAPTSFVQILVGSSPTPRPTPVVAGAAPVAGAPVQNFVQIEPPATAIRAPATPVPPSNPTATATATPTGTTPPTAIPTAPPSPTRPLEPKPTSVAAPFATPVPTRS